MMAEIKWNAPDSTTNILTTELNTLGAGSNKLSAAFSNDAAGELDLYADFELYVAAPSSARNANAAVELYILTELDGSNYVYGSDSVDPPATALVGVFRLPADTTAVRDIIRGVVLPPTDFKVLVINETGQAFAASGNTLKYARYNMQSA
jgi:hypothetical protein